jgi:hypothetical protein
LLCSTFFLQKEEEEEEEEEEERKVIESRQYESFPPENLAHFLAFSHPLKGAPITQTSNPSKLFHMISTRN